MSANEVDVHVGQRTRHLRETLGISQGTLGRHLGLTFSQVQKYEKGTNRIGAGRLFKIAEFLDVPVQYFFEGLGESGEAPGERSQLSGERSSELAALTDAFRSISDPDTRRSVVALVCSLAAAGPEASPPPSRSAPRAPRRDNGVANDTRLR
ncbi:helix-turn-helix transcriptional regulator [uncultured Amaricoccus sp.]|uniref:helix-turn-helix domain-containing protein n=1 Tax=uncultured Amaricoccus sp. TaxID=339341 RepID=UPI0026277CFF|nr:helix-turn-helix transcriptional regulator [uncultured Amaricoccus sp.]